MGASLTSGEGSFETSAGSTTGSGTTTLLTFPCISTPSAYGVFGWVSGFEPTGPSAFSSYIQTTVKSTGGSASVLSPLHFNTTCDSALNAATFQVSSSGNNILITVTGVAGLNIDWTLTSLIQIAQ